MLNEGIQLISFDIAFFPLFRFSLALFVPNGNTVYPLYRTPFISVLSLCVLVVAIYLIGGLIRTGQATIPVLFETIFEIVLSSLLVVVLAKRLL